MEAPCTSLAVTAHYLEARSTAIQWSTELRALLRRFRSPALLSAGQPFSNRDESGLNERGASRRAAPPSAAVVQGHTGRLVRGPQRSGAQPAKRWCSAAGRETHTVAKGVVESCFSWVATNARISVAVMRHESCQPATNWRLNSW